MTQIKKQISFQFSLIPTILLLLGLALFVSLAHWQWDRYHYKQHLLAQYEKMTSLTPKAITDEVASHLHPYEIVQATGKYLFKKSFLLQNRVQDKKSGYEVITPFKLDHSNKVLLVNRGWIRHAKDFKPNLVTRHETIVGRVKFLSRKSFILGDNIQDRAQRPLQMQRIEIAQLNTILSSELFPFVLRLNTNQEFGFKRNWQVVNMIPEKHIGYAIQWLLFAFIALGVYLYQSTSIK